MNQVFLPFRLQSTWLMLDAACVRKILGAERWLVVPCASEHLPGILAWKGRALPLLDLSQILALGKSRPGESRRTLIVQRPNEVLAIPVDAVREVRHVPQSELQAPRNAIHPYASAEAEIEGHLTTLLDLPALLESIADAGRAA